jgi:hypothetical protein
MNNEVIYKYKHNPKFNHLVKLIVSQLKNKEFTTSDLKDAILLACSIYEEWEYNHGN